jgi:hypothetical protein
MVRFSIVVAVLAAGCAKSCNRADVERVIQACRVEAAGPNIYRCRDAAAPPTNRDWVGESVENCTEENAEPIIACLSANAGLCADAGVEAAVARCSEPGASSGGGASSHCVDACTNVETTCSKQCPQSSWQACSSCQTDCTRARRRCVAGCQWRL